MQNLSWKLVDTFNGWESDTFATVEEAFVELKSYEKHAAENNYCCKKVVRDSDGIDWIDNYGELIPEANLC